MGYRPGGVWTRSTSLHMDALTFIMIDYLSARMPVHAFRCACLGLPYTLGYHPVAAIHITMVGNTERERERTYPALRLIQAFIRH